MQGADEDARFNTWVHVEKDRSRAVLGMPFALLTWMWLSVFVVLLGAEINGQAEQQTHQGTTVGSQLPAGPTGAADVDTVRY